MSFHMLNPFPSLSTVLYNQTKGMKAQTITLQRKEKGEGLLFVAASKKKPLKLLSSVSDKNRRAVIHAEIVKHKLYSSLYQE